MAELEALTRAMEDEQLPLGDLVKSFERGQDLLNYCEEALGSAEKQIELIQAQPQESSSEDDAAPKASKKTTTKRASAPTDEPSPASSPDTDPSEDDVQLF